MLVTSQHACVYIQTERCVLQGGHVCLAAPKHIQNFERTSSRLWHYMTTLSAEQGGS